MDANLSGLVYFGKWNVYAKETECQMSWYCYKSFVEQLTGRTISTTRDVFETLSNIRYSAFFGKKSW